MAFPSCTRAQRLSKKDVRLARTGVYNAGRLCSQAHGWDLSLLATHPKPPESVGPRTSGRRLLVGGRVGGIRGKLLRPRPAWECPFLSNEGQNSRDGHVRESAAVEHGRDVCTMPDERGHMHATHSHTVGF